MNNMDNKDLIAIACMPGDNVIPHLIKNTSIYLEREEHFKALVSRLNQIVTCFTNIGISKHTSKPDRYPCIVVFYYMGNANSIGGTFLYDDNTLDMHNHISMQEGLLEARLERVRQAYLDKGGNGCINPKCVSDDISGGPIQMDGDCAWQKCECGVCHVSWQDVYKLSDVENISLPAGALD